MANRKITDLAPLTAAGVSGSDLMVIVDISDFTAAPTGTTKKIDFINLIGALTQSGYFATFNSGSASNLLFQQLANVLNPLTASYYVKVNAAGNGIEYIDPPGQNQKILTLGGTGPLAIDPNVQIGHVVYRDAAGQQWRTASAQIDDKSEGVGVVQSVGGGVASVVFNGLIDFGANPYAENGTSSAVQAPLADGYVYYVGLNGYLNSVDPMSISGSWASKPILVANGTQTGLVVSYRSLRSDMVDPRTATRHKTFYDPAAAASLRTDAQIKLFLNGVWPTGSNPAINAQLGDRGDVYYFNAAQTTAYEHYYRVDVSGWIMDAPGSSSIAFTPAI